MFSNKFGDKEVSTSAKAAVTAPSGPVIISRNDHNVSRQNISDNALKVLYRLQKGGFDAYLVGGGVRDMLLGLSPKDFDIATNATPEQIKALFKNCRLIGRRFRLAHIVFGRDIIEVATFRGHHTSEDDQHCQKTSKHSNDGMLLRDNIYGSIEEDAERRDFTINALYYSVSDFNIYDYANGVADIKQRLIRLIGDPTTRYREDPVRMLRAIRFATKLDMTIEENTAKPITPLAQMLENIPPARMFEEFLKLFLAGKALANFEQLRHYQLFQYLFPITEQYLKQAQSDLGLNFVRRALENTDVRINQELRVTPAFLLAAFLWYPLQAASARLQKEAQLSPQDAFYTAYGDIMSEQQRAITIPKRFQLPMKDIWWLQHRLNQRTPAKAFKLVTHPKFRAAYDFLLLRGEIEGGDTKALANWWTEFQASNNETQTELLKQVKSTGAKRRTNRKRRKPQRGKADEFHDA